MSINYNYIYAQKLFGFKELLDLSSCTSPACIEKKVKIYGYKKMPAPKLPVNVKEVVSFNTDKKDNGTYNSLSWIVFNDSNGSHRYVSFEFLDINHFKAIQMDMMKRNYKQVSIKKRDLGNGFMSYALYMRNGNSGISLTTDDVLIYPSTKTVRYSISLTTISTAHWPDDEK